MKTKPLIDLARKIVFKLNGLLHNYDEVIWLLGDGRSGTTWVADLINHDKIYREMFEPIHPSLVSESNFLLPHQYIRQNDLDEQLMQYVSNIFSGKFTNSRVDSGNRSILYKGLLVKDIFANLLCYAVCLQFPKVKPLLLIRNPFSVALSKYKKKEWVWMTTPLDLLNQKELYEDFLYQFEDIIKETSAKNDYILNQILIWSIINYIPLHQFKPDDIHVCFYENIYAEPNAEISKILQFIGGKNQHTQSNISNNIIRRPSRVSDADSTFLSAASPLLSFKKELSHHVIDEGLIILSHFGFDNLYDDMSMPDLNVLNRIQYQRDKQNAH